jgi:PKD repeat protein
MKQLTIFAVLCLLMVGVATASTDLTFTCDHPTNTTIWAGDQITCTVTGHIWFRVWEENPYNINAPFVMLDAQYVPGDYTWTTVGVHGGIVSPYTIANNYGTDEYYTWTIGSGTRPPTASFTAAPLSGDSPLTVTFTDTSTGSPTSWFWQITSPSGAVYDASTQNTEFTLNEPGTYDVSLTATNAGGSETETKLDYISVGSQYTQTFTVYDESLNVIPSALVYMSDGSAAWTNGAGVASITYWYGSGSMTAYAVKGGYTSVSTATWTPVYGPQPNINLYVSADVSPTPTPTGTWTPTQTGTATGTPTATPTPTPEVLTADFTYSTPATYLPQTITLTSISTGQGITDYTWGVYYGEEFQGSSVSAQTFQFNAAHYGIYQATLVITNGSGSDSETKYIAVSSTTPTPTPTVTPTPTPTPSPVGATLSWNKNAYVPGEVAAITYDIGNSSWDSSHLYFTYKISILKGGLTAISSYPISTRTGSQTVPLVVGLYTPGTYIAALYAVNATNPAQQILLGSNTTTVSGHVGFHGLITDQNGANVSGATINIMQGVTTAIVYSDANGTYSSTGAGWVTGTPVTMSISKNGYDTITPITFTPWTAEDVRVDVAMFYRAIPTVTITTLTTIPTTMPTIITAPSTSVPTSPPPTVTPTTRPPTTTVTTILPTTSMSTTVPTTAPTAVPMVSIFGYVKSSVTGNGVSGVSITCTNLGSGGGGGSYGPTGISGYWIVGNCVRGDTYHCVGVRSGGTVTSKDIVAA